MPSSYFSPPSPNLDPVLFTEDKLNPEVRHALILGPMRSMEEQGLAYPQAWLKIWLTGSAISYQWEADRGNGDLDVQLGIEYEQFLAANPEYQNVDEYLMTDRINRYLREKVWPEMAHMNLNGKSFEVTYFWNYNVHEDIAYIRPYAAYDVIEDKWIIKPPHLPEDPSTLYPASWYSATKPDELSSQRLSQRYSELSQQSLASSPGSPGWINAQSGLRLIEAQAQSLFDEIHGGRHEAFSKTGKGYGDFHNFRWQRAKQSGTIERLHQIISSVEPRRDSYGNPIKSSNQALEEALTYRLGKPYG